MCIQNIDPRFILKQTRWHTKIAVSVSADKAMTADIRYDIPFSIVEHERVIKTEFARKKGVFAKCCATENTVVRKGNTLYSVSNGMTTESYFGKSDVYIRRVYPKNNDYVSCGQKIIDYEEL